MIEEVQAADRAFAQRAIAIGVESAQTRWIEAPLIAEALMIALIDVAQTSQTPDKVAKTLRALACMLDEESRLH